MWLDEALSRPAMQSTALTLFVLPAILKLVFSTREDDRTWRQRWWDRLRRNVTSDEQRELKDIA